MFRRVEQDDPVWDRTTFGKNRDRLPAGEVVATFFDAISCQARAAGLPSDEHFAVDGHALGTCERQCDDTHQSRTTEINAASDRLDALAAQGGRSYRCPRVTDRVFRVTRSR